VRRHCTWFIEAPYQSARMAHYLLSRFHLRPIEDVKRQHSHDGATTNFCWSPSRQTNHPTPLDPKSWYSCVPSTWRSKSSVANDARALRNAQSRPPPSSSPVALAEAPLSDRSSHGARFCAPPSELYGAGIMKKNSLPFPSASYDG